MGTREASVGRMARGSMMVYGGKWGKMVKSGMGGKDGYMWYEGIWREGEQERNGWEGWIWAA